MKRKTKSVELDPDLHKRLCMEAASRGITIGAHVDAVLVKHGVPRRLPKHVFGKAVA